MAVTIMDRAAQMFPELTPAQIERIASVGERREIRAGEMLFDVGDQNTRFFVVLSGAVDIVRPVGDREEPVTAHHRETVDLAAETSAALRPFRTLIIGDAATRRAHVQLLRSFARASRQTERSSPSTETIYVPSCSATRR